SKSLVSVHCFPSSIRSCSHVPPSARSHLSSIAALRRMDAPTLRLPNSEIRPPSIALAKEGNPQSRALRCLSYLLFNPIREGMWSLRLPKSQIPCWYGGTPPGTAPAPHKPLINIGLARPVRAVRPESRSPGGRGDSVTPAFDSFSLPSV